MSDDKIIQMPSGVVKETEAEAPNKQEQPIYLFLADVAEQAFEGDADRPSKSELQSAVKQLLDALDYGSTSDEAEYASALARICARYWRHAQAQS